MAKNFISYDVMVNNGETYYGEVKVPHCPIFKVRYEDVIKAVLKKYPTLKNREYTLYRNN